MARLIDTSVFIELERRRQALSVLDVFIQGDQIAIASISASELLNGVHRSVSEQQRLRRLTFVEGVLSRVPVLAFDLATARTHAWLSLELASRGQPIGLYDLLIAATALTRGYGLLTHNLNHFRRVPDLIVEEPTWQ